MYTMKILSNKEFDSLPVHITRGSRIDDSLGFADPATNTAYVRHTAWPELNSYLMSHELEHLLEEHKTDVDENGICHKKGGGFWSVAVPVIASVLGAAVLGPVGAGLGGTLGGGLGTAGGAIGGALGYGAGAAGGATLGNAGGNVITGQKPDWANSAIKGAASGVSAGLGPALGASGYVGSGLGSTLGSAASYGIGNAGSSSSGSKGSYTSSGEFMPDTTSTLGSIPSAIGQYGGTFTGQSGQSPSGMGPGAGGGNIGIMNTGLNQGGIALGAQNTLGGQGENNPSFSSSQSYDGMSNMNFNDMFKGMNF